MNNAYAKIGLIADRVWAQEREDSFVKLNRLLWIQVGERDDRLAARGRIKSNYSAPSELQIEREQRGGKK